jgi:hypothetical protein
VEIPVIEKYNAGRDPEFKIQVTRVGGALVRYRLAGTQRLPDRDATAVELPDSAAERRVLTPCVTVRTCSKDRRCVCGGRAVPGRPAAGIRRSSPVSSPPRPRGWLACYEIWHETGEWPLPEANDKDSKVTR